MVITKSRTKIRGFTVSGDDGLNSRDVANEILTNLDGHTCSDCRALSRAVRRRLKRIIDRLTALEDNSECSQEWVDILSIRNPQKLINSAKVQLHRCMNDDTDFPKCEIIKILLGENLINLTKEREGCDGF